jgi:hypothetical protein
MPKRPLRVSFDLDDCLICCDPAVPSEPRGFLHRMWFREPLRLGTIQLMKDLIRQGWRVWIYTTSYRSPLGLKWWFRWQGVRLEGVVNQAIHIGRVTRAFGGAGPSKYPRAFGIDLHVDDSEGVRTEGLKWGFEVVVVRPDDARWRERVLEAAERVMSQQRRESPPGAEARNPDG